MFWIVGLLMFAIGMGCGTYLVVQGHPWFALLAFLLTAGISLRKSDDKKPTEPDTLPDLSKVVKVKEARDQ